MKHLLDEIDLGLLLAGTGVALAAFVVWVVGGRRDPLAGAPLRPNRLNAFLVWLCLAVQFLLGYGLGGEMATRLSPPGLDAHGLENWRMLVASLFTHTLTAATCLGIGSRTFVGGLSGMGLYRRSLRFDLVAAFLGWLVAIALTMSVLHLTEWLLPILAPFIQPVEHGVFEVLKHQRTSTAMRVITLLSAFVAAPLSEELLFRGILQTGLHRLWPWKTRSCLHRWTAILIVGLLFGAMHLGTPQNVPALAALGIFLGFLYERTGSLRVCILLHMVFNGRSLLWEYLLRTYGL